MENSFFQCDVYSVDHLKPLRKLWFTWPPCSFL